MPGCSLVNKKRKDARAIDLRLESPRADTKKRSRTVGDDNVDENTIGIVEDNAGHCLQERKSSNLNFF